MRCWLVSVFAASAVAAEWEGYERLTREALLAKVAETPPGTRPELMPRT